jgi:hypothetical protein
VVNVGNNLRWNNARHSRPTVQKHLFVDNPIRRKPAQNGAISAAIVLITYRFVAPQVKILSPCPEQQDRCTISGVLEVKKEIPDDTPAQLVLFQRGLCRTARQ